jgi:ABC-type multidrug transport system fused ATPase/permease subunit
VFCAYFVLQENILMGQNFEPSRYQVAAEQAQLLPDLKMWPDGDATEIGDRGVTLSGGQKARVSIARAVYADADVYLMDDPLAAVDTHVGRALFERCIRGVLRSKTVILVRVRRWCGQLYLPSTAWLTFGREDALGVV